MNNIFNELNIKDAGEFFDTLNAAAADLQLTKDMTVAETKVYRDWVAKIAVKMAECEALNKILAEGEAQVEAQQEQNDELLGECEAIMEAYSGLDNQRKQVEEMNKTISEKQSQHRDIHSKISLLNIDYNVKMREAKKRLDRDVLDAADAYLEAEQEKIDQKMVNYQVQQERVIRDRLANADTKAATFARNIDAKHKRLIKEVTVLEDLKKDGFTNDKVTQLLLGVMLKKEMENENK